MADWLESMQRTYEYYVVDPGTWKDIRKITNVKSCTISRDEEADTRGSATIDVTESIGECYIRVYMVTIQNGVTEKHPLGTFLVQTPSSSYNGRVKSVTMDAYTPLMELKENQPPLGYSILRGENIMDYSYNLARENARAPVVKTNCSDKLFNDFVATPQDTWLSYISDLATNAKYKLDLDELGRILFAPKQDIASLQPVWTYTDDNCSILYPEVTMNHDLYGIPNVVEVLYSSATDHYYARVVNDDPNSPISTVSRGREIVYRVSDPDLIGDPTEDQIHEYAEQLLRDLSSIEYRIAYTHGYCPVRVGDCVRFDYKLAGLTNIKAKVTSQNIKCTPDCSVTETATFTTKLWG